MEQGPKPPGPCPCLARVIVLVVYLTLENNQVRTILTAQTVRTMGWGHLSPNPNLAMEGAPLIVTCLKVWH